MSYDPHLRGVRCGDCAFSPGTAANQAPFTDVKAKFCAMIGEPFWCHVGEPHPLCMGWAEAVLDQPTAPKDLPEWKRRHAGGILKWIESVEDRDRAGNVPKGEVLEAEFWAMHERLMEEIDANEGQP